MEIKDYIVRRFLLLVPTMVLIAGMTFVLTRMAGDPTSIYVSRYATQEQIQQVREAYGLDEPLWTQFYLWLRGVVTQLDLGFSQTANMPVRDALFHFAPATFELAILGVIIATTISVILGTLAGRYPDTWIDHGSRAFAVGGMSTPQFWAALILLYLGFVWSGLFPLGRAEEAAWNSIAHPTGFYTVDAIFAMSPRALGDALWHLILPALVIGYAESAVITRHLRSEIIEKTREEFVDAARARGLKEKVVYNKHIRRNALIPTVTVAGLSFAFLMRGIVVVELVFAWPGLGRWVANAALSGDYAAVMGFILVVAVLVLLINLSVDVLYAYLDPRIELGE